MNQTVNSRLAQAASCISPPILRLLANHFSEIENKVREIRLRVGRPVTLSFADGNRWLTTRGALTDLPCGDLAVATRDDIEQTFQRACEYSVYARQRELSAGYLTLRGGHRIGICGTAVIGESGVINVRHITSLNVRVASERLGCGEGVFESVRKESGGVLLCGEPCSGKTTLLRDLARLFSVEAGKTVSLIDERGELAAVSMGEAQNDVGFCDVFDGYPKSAAFEQALRCMAPQVIVCDEIGSREDAAAVRQCLHSGVRVIAAAHAADERELYARPALQEILATGAFETLVFLRGREHAGEVAAVVRGRKRRAA